jgi:hypothetical protein
VEIRTLNVSGATPLTRVDTTDGVVDTAADVLPWSR